MPGDSALPFPPTLPSLLLRVAGAVGIALAALGLGLHVVLLVGQAAVLWTGGGSARDLVPVVVLASVQLAVDVAVSLAATTCGGVMMWGAGEIRPDGNRDVVRLAAAAAFAQVFLVALAGCCGGCGACGGLLGVPVAVTGLVGGVLALLLASDAGMWSGLADASEPPEF